MLIDLKTGEETAIVVGGGREAEFRAKFLLEQGARVTVVAPSFTKEVRALVRQGVGLVRRQPDAYLGFLKKQRPRIVFSTLQDASLNDQIVKLAHSMGSLVNVYDTPASCDFSMPATAVLGNIKVAVSTGGLSPAMALSIRGRVRKVIRPQDVLQVKLQGLIRNNIKMSSMNRAARKRLVYRVIRSRKVARFLKDKKLDQALSYAKEMIDSST